MGLITSTVAILGLAACGGEVRTAAFGERMRGRGAQWSAIEQLFSVQARRYGLVADRDYDWAIHSTEVAADPQGRLQFSQD